MSDLSNIFGEGAKVVISPDRMRAWVTLPRPARGVKVTPEAITEWLAQNGVVYGADAGLIHKASVSERYDELLEVARGKAPVPAAGGDYVLKIEKRPFTGLRALGDGALVYDDLSFLQEVAAGQVLAEVTPPTPAEDGLTVTGEAVPPREGVHGRALEGAGFALSADGRLITAPGLSHVAFVGEKLVVTPLTRFSRLTEEDGPTACEGNVLVEGDILRGAKLSATGSIFVAGRCVSCDVRAGNNLLLCGGMRNEGGFGHAGAAENVWGLMFEGCEVKAGGDICANHLIGCEAEAGGRAAILGGRALIDNTNLVAAKGVVAGTLGPGAVVRVGMAQDFIDRYTSVQKRIERLGLDIQALQQNITAHERVNKMRADRGKNDPAYKDMAKKRDQNMSVLNILNTEYTRLKRAMDQFAGVSVVVREAAKAGAEVAVDTRGTTVQRELPRCKFRRAGDLVEVTEIGGR